MLPVNIDDPVQRVLTILAADDRAGNWLARTTADLLIYAANHAQEIADSIVAIDEAIRWGFNFEMGSFETWDVLLQHPDILQKVLQDGTGSQDIARVGAASKEQGAGHVLYWNARKSSIL